MRVLLVTDDAACRGPVEEAVAAALAGGVRAVMLRAHGLAHEDLVAKGRGIAAACRRAGALLVVNGDALAAAALGADGVHLRSSSAPAREARAIAGEETLVGRSTHDLAEIDRALAEGADYVTFGPVHDTPSKRGILTPRGEAGLREAVRRAGALPVIALGGMTAANAGDARRAGAAGVACIREVLAAEDPRAAAAALLAAWEAAR